MPPFLKPVILPRVVKVFIWILTYHGRYDANHIDRVSSAWWRYVAFLKDKQTSFQDSFMELQLKKSRNEIKYHWVEPNVAQLSMGGKILKPFFIVEFHLVFIPAQSSMCEHLFVFRCRSKSSPCRWGHTHSSLPHHPGTQCPLEKHGQIISSCCTFYETDIIALGGFLMSAPCLFPAPRPLPFKQMQQSLTRKNALMVHFTHFLLFSHPDPEFMLCSSVMTKTLENVMCF